MEQVHELTRDNIAIIARALQLQLTYTQGMRDGAYAFANKQEYAEHTNDIVRILDAATALGLDLPTGT
jgi:hypothetical protein